MNYARENVLTILKSAQSYVEIELATTDYDFDKKTMLAKTLEGLSFLIGHQCASQELEDDK